MSYKILITDDSELERMYIEDIINSYFDDITVISANNGEKSTEIALVEKPDLILMDVEMPIMNGFDAIKILKNNPTTSKIPIIVISATNLYQEAYDLGAIDFIHKPYDKLNILTRLKTNLILIDSFREVEKREQEILKQKVRIKQQDENQAKQKEVMQRINEDILADLRYSRRIQLSVLPDKQILNKHLPEYFIINKPKSIVSGDFHWLSTIDESVILAVGDCTGHGVSGALMHMMGTIFMNDIIRREGFVNTGDILDQLRDYIMRFLNQTGKQGETQDGMDIALCTIDQENLSLQFSGANNPIYIIRDSKITELKGDRMPVGIHVNFDKPFSTQYFQLLKGDCLYLFTDGFADQFGGAKGKKFRYKHFKENLLDIHHENMEKQGRILLDVHNEWKGNMEQIDDILIFGLRIL